jgi:hypothetical protein
MRNNSEVLSRENILDVEFRLVSGKHVTWRLISLYDQTKKKWNVTVYHHNYDSKSFKTDKIPNVENTIFFANKFKTNDNRSDQ